MLVSGGKKYLHLAPGEPIPRNRASHLFIHFTGTEGSVRLSVFQKLERYFKYKTLLCVTKRHLSYKQFTDMVVTETENTGENDYFQAQPKWTETHFALMPGTELTPVTRVLCSPCCHEHPAVEQLPQHELPQAAANTQRNKHTAFLIA